MDVDIIISSIRDNPIYLVLTIILFGLSVFALIKSLYRIFIILLCIIFAYFFYLDINNDADYEKAKKEVKKDLNSATKDIKNKVPTYKEAKNKAQDLFDKKENDDDSK